MIPTLVDVGPCDTSLPVLKYGPEDLLVKEMLLVESVDEEAAEVEYLTLRKNGFTTMEAVRIVADHLQVPNAGVTYAGLKDEDG